MKIYLIITNFFLATAIIFGLPVTAQAATEFLFSWSVKNYVPPEYIGKIFPSKGSLIEVGLDLLDGNRLADLSKTEIRWFLDGALINSGNGLQKINFPAAKNGGNSHELRLTIPDYRGNTLEKIIRVPVVSPETVIDSRSPQNQIKIGDNLLQARPYFFNVANLGSLDFQWIFRGKPVTGEAAAPDFLNLNIQTISDQLKTSLELSVLVKNLFNPLEVTAKNINLFIR